MHTEKYNKFQNTATQALSNWHIICTCSIYVVNKYVMNAFMIYVHNYVVSMNYVSASKS